MDCFAGLLAVRRVDIYKQCMSAVSPSNSSVAGTVKISEVNA